MRSEERDYFAGRNDDGRLEFDTPLSRTFTVGELRSALELYPSETRVGVFGFDGGGDQIDLIHNAEQKRLGIIGDSQ